MTTEKQQTKTICTGTINQNGFCNKCGAMRGNYTGNQCGNIIDYEGPVIKVPEKQQTPLTKLKDLVNEMLSNAGDPDLFAVITHIESLLPEEKQMVIDAYNNAWNNANMLPQPTYGEQYFNETYGQ